MGKTFVYNTGNPLPDPPGTLKITCGIFFDGTRNNLKNTEIRKKVQGKGEFRNISASEDERRIFEKYAKDDNSFGNDFTNVARKYMCTERANYSIYVEGIATIDKADDEGGGFKYGRGKTGVIGKVRNGSQALAKRVVDLKKKDTESIELIVDIFGFSRGAAAARNFAYNLQKEAYPPKAYYPPVQGASRIDVDHETSEFMSIDKSWVKDGKLPEFGHFGTALLQAGLARELVDSMSVKVRFIGIYDTVASYDPTCLLIPSFEKKVGELHLHQLGSPRKAVHFTAADEHRKNFSLTRFVDVDLKTGIERNFPGVHSDVGGSYNHDVMSSAELSQSGYQPDPIEGVTEREYVWLEKAYFSGSLDAFRDELIEEGWFKKDQLAIEAHWKYTLTGTRYLYRGYSFIPLHFMCDYALPLVNEEDNCLFYSKIMADYALNDTFLDEVKAYMKEHIIEKNEKWTLKGNFKNEEEPEADSNVEVPVATAADRAVPAIQLEEVVVTAYKSDYLLRKLKNKYLHRSAKINTLMDTLAYSPNDDRKRKEF